jgi:hypothetical protein
MDLQTKYPVFVRGSDPACKSVLFHPFSEAPEPVSPANP